MDALNPTQLAMIRLLETTTVCEMSETGRMDPVKTVAGGAKTGGTAMGSIGTPRCWRC